jgi:glutamate/tyrosine decarboxylase-like PLP-dependent enzyme
MGTGTHVGLLADLVSSAMNCHVSGYDQSATLVERQVIEWLAEMLGFPEGTSGLLVSGGTAANPVGCCDRSKQPAGNRHPQRRAYIRQ